MGSGFLTILDEMLAAFATLTAMLAVHTHYGMGTFY